MQTNFTLDINDIWTDEKNILLLQSLPNAMLIKTKRKDRNLHNIIPFQNEILAWFLFQYYYILK